MERGEIVEYGGFFGVMTWASNVPVEGKRPKRVAKKHSNVCRFRVLLEGRV